MSELAAGYSEASKLMMDSIFTSAQAKKYRKSVDYTPKDIIKNHIPLQAISIFVDVDMTREQYEVIHAANKNVYSCYSLLKKRK